jgi:hypothetical protein
MIFFVKLTRFLVEIWTLHLIFPSLPFVRDKQTVYKLSFLTICPNFWATYTNKKE